MSYLSESVASAKHCPGDPSAGDPRRLTGSSHPCTEWALRLILAIKRYWTVESHEVRAICFLCSLTVPSSGTVRRFLRIDCLCSKGPMAIRARHGLPSRIGRLEGAYLPVETCLAYGKAPAESCFSGPRCPSLELPHGVLAVLARGLVLHVFSSSSILAFSSATAFSMMIV